MGFIRMPSLRFSAAFDGVSLPLSDWLQEDAAGPTFAATVNNRPITYSDLDASIRRSSPRPNSGESPDQTNIQKLEVLRGLIDNEIMLQRAEKQGLMATDADVEAQAEPGQGAVYEENSEAARGPQDDHAGP
jgi:peptidyl-prolyl cis-trans isomerase SurA